MRASAEPSPIQAPKTSLLRCPTIDVQASKVKAQKEACDNLLEWLAKHWALLLGVSMHFAPPPRPILAAPQSSRKTRGRLLCAPGVLSFKRSDLVVGLDDDAQLPDESHPADALLPVCLDLFDKCKDAKTAAQQDLPLKM